MYCCRFRVILLFLAVLIAATVFSQTPPTITSFSPLTGKPGDAITITGANFNTTQANNIVFFGATRATVTAASATSLTVTVPTGATFAPITVLNSVTALVAASSTSFTPTYSPAKTGITATDFSPKQDFTTGEYPRSVAIGDLDGDGKPDLAFANYTSSFVSVLRNTATSGSIVNGSFASKQDFTTGSNGSMSVAIGDLDGDGKPDLAVANSTTGNISVFRNISSAGSINFAAKQDFVAGSNPTQVAIGDIDADGKPELAVVNFYSNSISVFQNTSTSGTISFSTKQDFTVGSQPNSLAIGDLNGDGKPEMVATNSAVTNISLLSNTSTSGSISFAAKQDLSVGLYPYSVAIGDLDGDSKPDLAVANYGSDNVSILRNTTTSGSVTFAALHNFSIGGSTESVAIGDIDGDGKLDLAFAHTLANSIGVLRNTSSVGSIGNGSFATIQYFTTGTQPHLVAIGDLDGDGKPELTTAVHEQVLGGSVLRNVDLPPTITSFSPLTGKPGDAITITGSNFNTTPANNIVFLGATKATVTAASATSLTVTVPVGATYAPIKVLNTATSLAAASSASFTPTYSPAKTGITSTDFSASQDFTTGLYPYSIGIGDLDGDGKPDLAFANLNSSTVSVLRNTATSGSISSSSFAAKQDFTTGSGSMSVAIADFDGDGKPDLAVANQSTNDVSVLRNTSSIGTISFAAKQDFAAGNSPSGVAVGDFDGDGKPDLAVANYNSNSISVFRNTSSNGTISFATKQDFTTGSQPRSVTIGDLNGDGKPEMVSTNTAVTDISLFTNTSTSGSINFTAKQDLSVGIHPYSAGIGDLDGDGKPDLAVVNYTSNDVSILRNTTTGGSISFATRHNFSIGGSTESVAIGDLDGDGKPDLAFAHTLANSIGVLRNTSSVGSIGNGSFATIEYFATGQYPRSVAIVDLDGDGRPEIATALGVQVLGASVLRNADLPSNITTSVTSLSAFSACVGSVSAQQSFTTNGAGLSNNITITAPTGFEVSVTSGSGFASSLTLTQAGGVVATTTIYVRVAANATGSPSGNITVASTGATTKNVGVSATVNSLPAVPTISNNRPLTFCSGDSTVLSSSAATGNQWLLNGSNVVGATGQTLVVKTGGSYTVMNTNGSSCSATSTATTVVVNSLPAVPTISNNRPLTFCSGDSTVLSSSAATGNQWLLNGSNVVGATGQTLVVKTGGSYTVVNTNGSSCSATSTATTVVVNSLPATPTISNNRPLTFCVGDSTVLSSSAATGNQWLLNGSNVVGATGQTLVVKAAGSYTVVNTNANGCSATSSATTVVVNSLPAVPTISNNRPLTFCVGDSTILSSSAATGNQWLLNGSNMVGATGQTLVVKTSGAYTVVNTNANGCSATSSATAVVVNSLPATPIISNNRPLTFCTGDSTVLSSSAATGNQWVLNGSNVAGATGQTLVVKTSGSYTVINTNASGCSATSSATTVVVNSLPATPTISNNRPLTFCVGDSTVLSSSAASGNQWVLNGSNVAGATGQTLVVKSGGSYTVSVTNANGCSSVSSATTVVVNSLPATPTISNNRPLTFCTGDSTVLSSSAATGNQWVLNGSNVVGATGQTLVVKTSGSYSVINTNANGCSATSTVTTVVVNSFPATPTISNNRPLTFCVGDSTILSSSSATGNQWLLNGNNVVGATGQTLVVKTAGVYTVAVTNAGGCRSVSAGTTIVVNSLPTTPTISNNRPLTFCVGDSTVLSSSAATGNQWLLNGSNVVGATGQTLVVKTSGSYTVINTNASGCSATSTATTVVVNSFPATPTISNNRPLTFCTGDSTVLSSSAATGNQWLLNGNNVVGATGQTLVVKTAGVYTVAVTNAGGCRSVSSGTTVVVNSLPALPTISNNRPLIFCSGDSTVLSSSAATGNQWLLNGSNLVGATGQTLVVKTAGSYTIINTNASGCSATSSATTVVVNSFPATPTISNNRSLTFCVGDSTVLSSSAATSNQWLLNGNNVVGATGQTLVVKSAGVYTVAVTNVSGCRSVSAGTTVVVNSLPAVPTISNNRPLIFCSGDSTVLSSSAATGNQWLLNGSNLVGATGQTLVVKTSGSYAVRVTNANGCFVSSGTVNTVNNSTAGAGLAFRDSLICKATSLRVTAQAVSPTAFLWTGVRTGFSASTQSVNISNADMYRVRITLSNGCVVNDSINLRNTADTAIKARIAMTKQAFVNQQVLAVNITSVKPQTQNWVFSPGSTVISQNDSVALLRFATVGNYQVILNNTSYNVCKSADTARIVITTNDYPSTTTPPAIIIRNITIGPNPTTGISNVTIDLNKPGNVTMRIFNFNGTQIYTRAIANTTATTIRERIDISNQPSNNTYILVVQCEGSYEVRSILKN